MKCQYSTPRGEMIEKNKNEYCDISKANNSYKACTLQKYRHWYPKKIQNKGCLLVFDSLLKKKLPLQACISVLIHQENFVYCIFNVTAVMLKLPFQRAEEARKSWGRYVAFRELMNSCFIFFACQFGGGSGAYAQCEN